MSSNKSDSQTYKKAAMLDDVVLRGKEEFAEYFPRALKVVDQRALLRMGVRMADMVEVFRTVYLEGWMRASIVQLEELKERGR